MGKNSSKLFISFDVPFVLLAFQDNRGACLEGGRGGGGGWGGGGESFKNNCKNNEIRPSQGNSEKSNYSSP